ncbi:MAG TPA: hypothetical protein VFW68_05935 [Rhodocyclaceae bacterium]|nr:hypothetical protein [Rhodocyclaceae bacterium]
MFDSPFDYCPLHNEMVLLDQTVEECAKEHGCADSGKCPLYNEFMGTGAEARALQNTEECSNVPFVQRKSR